MPRFLVQAREIMETDYLVIARNMAEAREKVETLGYIGDGMEQIDASVYEVEAHTIDRLSD